MELWSTFLFLIAAAVPTLFFSRLGGGFNVRWIGCYILLILAGSALWYGLVRTKYQQELVFHSRIPSEGAKPREYVTSDQCRTCHPEHYQSWHKSYHRTMTQYASPEAIKAKFNGQLLTLDNTVYRPYRDGDQFWFDKWHVSQSTPDGKTPVGATSSRIGMLTGFHNMQTFWIPDEHSTLQRPFPFAWINADQQWVPLKDTFLRDPRLGNPTANWNSFCISCHSVTGVPNKGGTPQINTQVVEMGIACESCHGPAREHTARMRNPLKRYQSRNLKDPERKQALAILDPTDLDHRLASQVCGHCHGITYIPDKKDWAKHGFSYRPGDDLTSHTPIVQPSQFLATKQPKNHPYPGEKWLADRYWSDGMVRISGREYNGLIDSPCFERGTLSCLSCHSMHDSDPNDQLALGMDTNHACLQCHDNMAQDLEAHTKHNVNSSGSLCYNCHMPHTTYGLLKSIRSHQIDSPNAATHLDTGRPNACNLCHLDQTLKWTSNHLNEWFGQPLPKWNGKQESTASALLDLLKGEAGQRALVAWHMGWAPAQEASGVDWLAPWLAEALNDPYSAVRYIARRSLRTLPNFKDFQFDYLADVTARQAAGQSVINSWSDRPKSDNSGWKRKLMNQDGSLNTVRIRQLRSQRNHQSMDLQE